MIKKILLLMLLLISISIQATTIQSLRSELKTVNQELSKAIKQESEYAGGLIKTIIKSRVEILKINSALIQQRIHAIESGSQIKVHIDAVKPDPIRTKEVEAEIFSLMADIRKKKVEADKYTGGLIKVLLKSGIAILENSVAILKLELIKAKYGITWIPELNTPDITSGKSIVKDLNNITKIVNSGSSLVDGSDDSYNIIKPLLINKRFEDKDWQETIWFDIIWTPISLKNDTRAVKGVLIFEDIFGEEKFKIRKTITDTITVSAGLYESGIGFKYSQFDDSHRWVRTTNFEDMKFRFKVSDIIYKEKTYKSPEEKKKEIERLRGLEVEKFEKNNKGRSLREEIQAEEDQEREIAQEDILNELKTNYVNQIASRVKDKWRYQGAKDNWGCDVYILQDLNGKVEMVNLQNCNIDNSVKAQSFKNAIERAVYKASPLPQAPIKSMFDREILFHFRVN